ncbi:hypothetical protein [Streptomyces sp. CL7]|uniref:hypothetical protein n=1 Tax=Streptomyces sp. CL7 TaxID=3096006 RepID=UPI002A754DB1|nr:hypothetical protein [Streptomyces sp. CL7]WPP31161.1 hypothetical protein SJH97_18350 [Streptomyces sp. CL7]
MRRRCGRSSRPGRAGDLVAGIRVIATGDGVPAPSVTRRVIANFSHQDTAARPAHRLVGLTRREQEVLVLNARDRAQRVIVAYESGVAERGTPPA